MGNLKNKGIASAVLTQCHNHLHRKGINYVFGSIAWRETTADSVEVKIAVCRHVPCDMQTILSREVLAFPSA